jgi:hypothetical protein
MSKVRERLAAWGPWGLLGLFWLWKTSAIWRHLTTRHYTLWGVLYDTLHMHWMSWWTGVALTREDQSLFFSTLTNYPHGGPTDLDNSLAAAHAMLSGLLQLVVGSTTANNLVAVAGVALALVAFFLLLRRVSGDGLFAAVLAMLAFNYAICWERSLPDLELVQLGYIGLSLWAWVRFAEEGGRGRAAVAMVLVGWTCFTQMYYGLSLLMMLGTAGVLAWLGLSRGSVSAKELLRRTALVLVVGLGIAVLLHLRNLLNSMGLSRPEAGHHFSFAWWEVVVLVVAFVAPLVAAFFLAVPEALFWTLLALPVLLFAMGDTTYVGEREVWLPLQYLKSAVPILRRATFSFRFLAPMTLGLSLVVAAFYRHRARAFAGAGESLRRFAGPGLLALFWLVGALVPLPRMETGPLQEGVTAAEVCAHTHPAGCTLLERWEAECGDSADGEWTAFKGGISWFLGQVASPLLPLTSVALPPAPPCVEWLAQQPGETALIELSFRHPGGYSGYFQTHHGRPVVGAPSRSFTGPHGGDDPDPLQELRDRFQDGSLSQPPDGAQLGALVIGFVAVYREETTQFCQWREEENFGNPHFRRSFDGADGMAEGLARGLEVVEAGLGAPVCEDGVMVVYGTADAAPLAKPDPVVN